MFKKYVLYLYYTVGKDTSSNKHKKDYFLFDPYPVAGLLSPEIAKKTRDFRPFELQQENLYSLIRLSNSIHAKILRIDFDDIDPDLEDDINEAIRNNNIALLKSSLQLCSSLNVEIKAVDFLYKERSYRITKYAVVEITGEWEEVTELALTSPIAMVTGMKTFPHERGLLT